MNIKKTTTYNVENPGHCLGQAQTYNVENPGHCLGQAQTYGGVRPVNEIPTPPLGKCISNGKQYIYKQTIRNRHRYASTQTIHI